MRKKQNQYLEVEITELSKKGNGIGSVTNESGAILNIEVPFAIPKDKVKVLIKRKKNGYCQGKLEEIIQPSPLRILPKCVHFGTCGGCRYQNLAYEDQIEHKEKQVAGYFKNLINEDVTILPMVKSPLQWQYRNKMEYTFSSDAANNRYLGLIMDQGRGKVINLTECHLTNSWFIDALKAVRSWWENSDLDAYHMMRNTGSLRTLTLREGTMTNDRLVMLTVSGNPDFALHRSHLDSFVMALKNAVEPSNFEGATLSIFLRIHQIAKGMPTQFYEMHLYGRDHIVEKLNIKLGDEEIGTPISFSLSPTAFFQPNSQQASNLYSKAIELANFSKEDVLYDLYCGTGTIGISIAKYVKTVVGIEISPESSLDARQNAKKNGLNNYTVYTGDVSSVLENTILPLPDVLMIDPPRAGLEIAAIKQIVALNAKKIVYISCNPETQAHDVLELQSAGYKLIAIQPVDQFPQTPHIENIALLTR